MNILITGGAGFLGVHLADYFVGKDVKVTLVDVAKFRKSDYARNVNLVNADVRDRKTMLALTNNKDVVIHAAAALPLWPKAEIISVNVDGTRNVMRASYVNKVKRFIYISSTAVYGVPIKHPIIENDPLVGVGAYGVSKILAEKICRNYRKKGMIVTIVRPKTFIGRKRLGVFEILFDWVHGNHKIPVIGNGRNRYQLLDVDDLVDAIYLLTVYKNKKNINTEFNIGAVKFATIEEDLDALFVYAKSKSQILPTLAYPIKFILMILEKLNLSPLYRWVYDTADKDSYVSVDKLISVLNWHPRYSNSDALIKSYQWYRDNINQIKKAGLGITHTVGWKQGVLGLVKRIL